MKNSIVCVLSLSIWSQMFVNEISMIQHDWCVGSLMLQGRVSKTQFSTFIPIGDIMYGFINYS